ncbi:uncharacterized protein [Drosophila tropicalis]|uniref:uncharacterized protein isoform X1 n=1 Tax=Drosophila tropicalis TaxID=46794 RepID=UPI0035AC0B02
MAQNFIYMFEFVVDDILITRKNRCAPEEYPTCTELSFRSSVFCSVCDHEYGSCITPNQPKCGKCCLFTLDSPVTDKDRLQVHIYKKRSESCKFLIGLTDLAVKPMFDRVHESFDAENPNWERALAEHVANLPKMKSAHKTALDNCACYERGHARREQWCPTSETSKRLLPLFNLCKMQTGNIVLVLRLVCNGSAIVSTFPFNRICSRNPKCPEPCPPPPGDADKCAANNAGGPMDKGKKCCRGKSPQNPTPTCVQADPCARSDDELPKCLRYFSCNLDQMCPCDHCEDPFDRECPPGPSKRRALSAIEQRLQPCGPCSAVPPLNALMQEKEKEKKEKKEKEKEKNNKDKNNKDKDSKDKNEKDKSDGKKKKKRQSGGGFFCEDNDQDQWASHPLAQPPQSRYPSNPCKQCCPEYEACCDEARKRAIRKLRHLLVKYNIQID